MKDEKKEKKKKVYPNIKVTDVNEPNLDLVFKALKKLPTQTTSEKK